VFVAWEVSVSRVVQQPKVIVPICTAGLKWSIYQWLFVTFSCDV